MKREEATPSRTSILHRLSTGFILPRTINSSFIARDSYRVSICTPFSTTTNWFKNIPLYRDALRHLFPRHTPRCRFNLFNISTRLRSFFFLLYLSLSSLSSRSSTILKRLFSIAARLIFSLLKSCTCTPVVRIKRGRGGGRWVYSDIARM